MDSIQNRTFDELKAGETASLSRNPAHVDEVFAKSDMFHKVVAQGMWGGVLISTVLGTQLLAPASSTSTNPCILVVPLALATPLPSR